ncbi:putative bifunctional diguanylate cyclase/phosphodiesterase [Roseateles violae]|uniref:EAL domain-containing protein n=1 Tax=Roseateles violae TaxID=3058042 RepID=A0ABT8DSU9_9BURK|nr:EAL domain-containing protein [Pelomonas sp. PFR6]MDN3919984.1 EAL domain-containing protein [Pelomonas sp. PFR6]
MPATPDAQLLCDALDSADLGLIWVDEAGHVRHASRNFMRWAGAAADGVATPDLQHFFEGLSPLLWREQLQAEQEAGRSVRLALRQPYSQPPMPLLARPLRPLLAPPAGAITALLLAPLDERSEQDAVAGLQREVLEAVALGRPLQVVMDLLCRRVEALAPDVICTVLAVDESGQVQPLAAPSLPASFSAAIKGAPIGPRAGSCGTAAWRRAPVEVSDIGRDPLWDDYRELAQSYELAACWSNPIFTAADQVGATFALYYREPRPVAPFHRRMVEACVQLCQVALRHEEHQRQIERLAYYDGITGLPNRSLFADRAQQALQLALRKDTPGALLLLDFDRFKTINDSLGHASGDQVLKELSQRLLAQVRDTDTLARVGGDEFAAVLPGCSAVDAMHVADKLHAALHEPLRVQGVELKLSASIGIATFPADGQELESLLKNADIAMYEAKRSGRNCSRYFLQAMNRALDERLRIESALRRALSAGELSLHFQPKLSLADGALVGVEALLRWTDAELGALSPDTFIPVAEECGLVNALDAWVLEAACAQLSNWLARALPVPNIAVNVSALRFYQDDVAAHVGQLLVRHRLEPRHLTLEVTERLMLDDNEQARQQLRALDAMGVRLSVDDFGTGYSSLSYLKRLPVRELKLDKSFVRDLERDADDRALASAVIGIGRALGLSVVAEGVEAEGQQQALRAAGCETAQGYLYARPQTAAEFEGWLRQRSRA